MAQSESLAENPAAGSPLAEIRELCRKHGVQELYVFGSVLRTDYRPDSDVDFLVLFQPEAERGWAAHLQDLEADLSRTIGRKVDLISKRGVEQSRNWIRRRAIPSPRGSSMQRDLAWVLDFVHACRDIRVSGR